MAFSGNPPPSLRAARVLVADDDLISRKRLESLLRKRGYEVTSATDGLEALAVLEAIDSPSIAILDWMMPGLDGIEICRRIRQTPELSGIYVLLLTGRASRADLVAGLDAGADDYMIKPIDTEELRARVQVGTRAAKLQARNRTAGLTIGTPVLFSSVAHGSALDIAGKNLASPAAVIEAVERLAGAAAATG